MESTPDYCEQELVAQKFASPEQIDTLSDQYQQQILELQSRRRALHLLRNERATINRLPPEVLGEIFVLVAQSYAENEYFDRHHSNDFGWLAVAQVCQRWRRVALDTARVWSFIPLRGRHIRWIDPLLQRSRRTGLTMIQSDYKNKIARTVLEDTLYEHMDRIKMLAVCLDSENIGPDGETLKLEAPLLETLKATFADKFCGRRLEHFANASWPCLKSLECVYASPEQLQALLRPTLTSLTVERTTPFLTIEVLLGLLANLSQLRSLRLMNCIEDMKGPMDQAESSSRPVDLPSLQALHLHDTTVGISSAHLLNHLIIPSSASVHFTSRSKGTRDQVSFIVSAFAAKTHGPEEQGAAKALDIATWDYLGTRISLYWQDALARVDRTTDIPWPPPPCGTLPKATLSLGNFGDEVLDAFTSHRDLLSEIRHVRCQSTDLDEKSSWDLLGKLPSIEELDLDSIPYSSVSSFLKHFDDDSTFPNLRALRLSSVVWNRRHRDLTRGNSHDGSLLFPLLRALVIRQQCAPLPLQTLELLSAVNLGISDKDEAFLDQLVELVEEFEYDDAEDDASHDCSTCPSEAEDDETRACSGDEGDEDLPLGGSEPSEPQRTVAKEKDSGKSDGADDITE
ncbi:F-box protein [Phanerochaete sordida]|uniref:F-box protein n=1 Tax=Phanerochaete sordida TaxID=48140 RepID=A0A9P3G8J2_9APHY|nr:F-box protein [Phanerochaete sordida]